MQRDAAGRQASPSAQSCLLPQYDDPKFVKAHVMISWLQLAEGNVTLAE